MKRNHLPFKTTKAVETPYESDNVKRTKEFYAFPDLDLDETDFLCIEEMLLDDPADEVAETPADMDVSIDNADAPIVEAENITVPALASNVEGANIPTTTADTDPAEGLKTPPLIKSMLAVLLTMTIRLLNIKPGKDGVKFYNLSRCPFDSSHDSAAIISFADGGTGFKCFHPGCKDRKISDLYILLGIEKPKTSRKEGGKDLSPTEFMCGWFDDNVEFVQDENGVTYAKHGAKVIPVYSQEFRYFCIDVFRTQRRLILSRFELDDCQEYAGSVARVNGITQKLFRRVGKLENGDFCYAYVGDMEQSVRISPDRVELIPTPPIFKGGYGAKPQVEPNLPGDIHKLRRHFNLQRLRDYWLLIIHICCLFVPTLPTPILLLYGEMGSAKSTALLMIKQIVDSAKTKLRTQPKKLDDLAIALSREHLVVLDNLSEIVHSDLYCNAVTGGEHSKRKLYTDDSEISIDVQTRIAISSINLVVKEADLLDRIQALHLARIPKEERLSDTDVWEAFIADLPDIVGGIFTTLSQAMAIYPRLKISGLPRMAEYSRWGCAICEALGYPYEKFLNAYRGATSSLSREFLSGDTFANVILAYMSKTRLLTSGSPHDVYNHIKAFATKEMNQEEAFPKSDSAFMRRLNEKAAVLREAGIYYANGFLHGKKHLSLSMSPITTQFEDDPDNPFDPDDFDEWGDPKPRKPYEDDGSDIDLSQFSDDDDLPF